MFKETDFRKASSCVPHYQEACVEVAINISDKQVGIRDSKNPNQPALAFDQQEWRAFINGVKRGEFDV